MVSELFSIVQGERTILSQLFYRSLKYWKMMLCQKDKLMFKILDVKCTNGTRTPPPPPQSGDLLGLMSAKNILHRVPLNK